MGSLVVLYKRGITPLLFPLIFFFWQLLT